MCTVLAILPWLFMAGAFALLMQAAWRRQLLSRALGAPAKMRWGTLWLVERNAFGPAHEPQRRAILMRVLGGMGLLVLVAFALLARNMVCGDVP